MFHWIFIHYVSVDQAQFFLMSRISDSTRLDAAVLMDKGIIIGAEHESSVMSKLPFVTFRHATSVRINRVRSALSNQDHSRICFCITFCVFIWQLAKYRKRCPSRRTTSISFSSHTLLKFSFTQSSSPKQPGRIQRRMRRAVTFRPSSSFWTISMSRSTW